jgi:hypothetical protein
MSDPPASSGTGVSRKGQAASFVLLAAVGIYATIFSWKIGLWRGSSPGEGLFPFLAALAVTALSIVGLVGLAFRPAGATFQLDRDALRRLGCYLAALVFYGGTLEALGFFVSTILSLTFILAVAERYTWRPTLALVVGTVVGSYLLFAVWLGVIFPDGTLWQVFVE